MIPAVLTANDTLCTKDHAVFCLVFKSAESADKLVSCIAVGCFDAPACEHLVCVVVAVVTMAAAGAFLIVVMVMLVVIVVMATAGALFIVMVVMMVIVVVMVIMIVATAGAFFIVMVVMMITVVVMVVMIVTSAGALFVVMVVMMVTVVVMVIMIVAAASAIFIVMVVMMVIVVVMIVIVTATRALLVNKGLKLILESHFLFHSAEDLLAGKLIPISCYDLCSLVMSTDKLNCFEDLLLCKSLCMAENNSACAFDLVIEKLTEVLHIHLALLRINNSSCGIENDIGKLKVLNSLDNVGKLANA